MQLYQSRNLIIKGQSNQRGNLWLGDFQAARDKKKLKADQIFHIVTAGLGMKVSFNNDFKHKVLPLYDAENQNIERFFDSTYQFIDESLKQGNVLVHCYAGVSRSTTILTAYLMKKNLWTLSQTLSKVKKSRPVIRPNKGFMNQLRKFQSKHLQDKDMKLSQIVSIKQNSTTVNRKNFVQGFLTYKRGSSVVHNNSNIKSKQPKKYIFGERSKTISKQIQVIA